MKPGEDWLRDKESPKPQYSRDLFRSLYYPVSRTGIPGPRDNGEGAKVLEETGLKHSVVWAAAVDSGV